MVVGVPLIETITSPGWRPSAAAGVPETTWTSPTPFAVGWTDTETTAARTVKKMTARTRFARTPAAATRARLRRGAAFISTSSCSTNAPTGMTSQRTPMLFTPIFCERAITPCIISWSTTPMINATRP